MRDSWELQAHSVPCSMLAMSLTEVSACVEPFKNVSAVPSSGRLSHPPPQPSHVNKPSAVQTSSEGGWLEIQILIGLNGFLFHYSSADLLV